MLKILISVISLLLASTALAQVSLKVTIKGIKEPAGEVYIALFDNPDQFLKTEFHKKVVSVVSDSAAAVFENLPSGAYALSVFHDRNRNGKLDSNGVGIPDEGFAFGNNAMGFFGPPSFRKASITVQNSNLHHVVILKHF